MRRRVTGIILVVLGIAGCFLPVMPGIALILLGLFMIRGKHPEPPPPPGEKQNSKDS